MNLGPWLGLPASIAIGVAIRALSWGLLAIARGRGEWSRRRNWLAFGLGAAMSMAVALVGLTAAIVFGHVHPLGALLGVMATDIAAATWWFTRKSAD